MRTAKAPVCSPVQKEKAAISRRQFLFSTAALLAAAGADRALAEAAADLKPGAKKVVVGGNPWVYAAPLPRNDINPILPAIFEDFSYAGLDGIELMPITLRPPDAVERIEELSRKNPWFIRQYGKQVVFLHLRDQKNDGRWSEALGEGDTDFAAISRALNEIGFQGDAVIELAHEADFQETRPLRESLKISREFVRNKLGY